MVELRTRLLPSDPWGTKIMRSSGYVFIKTNKGVRPEAQVVAEQKILNRQLEEGERVFHRDCRERSDNRPENLVVLHFRTDKFRPLPSSRVIYIPRQTEKIAA
jgi:hypothetical protein